MPGYEAYTDEELIAEFHKGKEAVIDYIMEKYKSMVRKKARAMYLIGGENEDLIQEGMIGLFKAIQDYQPDRNASFSSFAQLCVSRQIYTAVNASNRKKHIPLNSYISLYADMDDGEEKSASFQDILMSVTEKDPEEIWIDHERVMDIQSLIQKKLSDFENDVLTSYLQGKGYIEISEELGKEPKSVDNALQRIRQKIQYHLKEME